MTWTSVVSYHTDPERCGVARFSAQLAQRLGVPHKRYVIPDKHRFDWGEHPLFSIKWSEQDLAAEYMLYDQLWHDQGPKIPKGMPWGRVWKLYELGVPSLIVRPVMAWRALFTFGMAHKVDLKKFIELHDHFPGRQLWISTAEHEGAGPSKVPELMLAWGDQARNLGHLSDAALELVWPRVSAFVAFFEAGLRANNSSVHAALDAGVPVITNHGPATPRDLKARTVDYRTIGQAYWPMATGTPYTWDRLLRELGVHLHVQAL